MNNNFCYIVMRYICLKSSLFEIFVPEKAQIAFPEASDEIFFATVLPYILILKLTMKNVFKSLKYTYYNICTSI